MSAADCIFSGWSDPVGFNDLLLPIPMRRFGSPIVSDGVQARWGQTKGSGLDAIRPRKSPVAVRCLLTTICPVLGRTTVPFLRCYATVVGPAPLAARRNPGSSQHMPSRQNGTVHKFASPSAPARRPPARSRNADRRPREHLTPAEVERLIETAKKRGRYGQRDASARSCWPTRTGCVSPSSLR